MDTIIKILGYTKKAYDQLKQMKENKDLCLKISEQLMIYQQQLLLCKNEYEKQKGSINVSS